MEEIEKHIEEKFEKYQNIDTFVDRYLMFLCGISFSVFGSILGWHIFERGAKKEELLAAKQKKYAEVLTKIHNPNPKIQETFVSSKLFNYFTYFGKENYEKVRKSFIVVVGQGGVGSHVTSSQVRAGVAKLRIVDFDQVSVSSLNRHAFALTKDAGLSKVEVVKEYCKKINPNVHIETFEILLEKSNLKLLLDGEPDYVIDCIDNIHTKTDLLEYCNKQKIKVVCSGGAGMRTDPTKLLVRDISNTSYDPQTKSIRNKLKKRKINSGIPVLYSNESAQVELLPLQDHQEENPADFRLLDKMRVRVVPVVGTMPALFGHSLASYVIKDIAASHQTQNGFIEADDIKYLNYQRQQNRLNNYIKAKKLEAFVDFDIEDVYFVCRDMADWNSVLSEKQVASMEQFIWDMTKNINGKNLILVTLVEMKQLKKRRDNNLPLTENSEELERVTRFLKKCEKHYDNGFPIFSNTE